MCVYVCIYVSVCLWLVGFFFYRFGMDMPVASRCEKPRKFLAKFFMCVCVGVDVGVCVRISWQTHPSLLLPIMSAICVGARMCVCV